ncbi:restriction endonuclease subunit S [Listeria seeligeri]|uniref:restriction endonuclease subunit S n=1 Tax=Listeria seeligeri TaxID=1640 RepID=UPI0018875046|nr:restriction endonuclease subunit S [Listeria seeligeri]MBF2598445.1 restriction endonuclease subunit S [Listeria seeligeri]
MSHSKKNVPKRRLKDFSNTEDWEQRKLGELYKTYSGMTPLRSDASNFENPDIPWIKTTDLRNTVIKCNEEKISDKAAKKLKLLSKGTVLIAMYGGFNQIGRTGLLIYPATINQALTALEPIKEITSYFLLTELNHRVNDWKRLAASSRKDPNITKNDVENFNFYFPKLEEQIEIGRFFKQLDNTIALHQRKLEKIKALKTAYLSEMFPVEGELKPKRRFEGFTEEWEKRKLRDNGKPFIGLSGKKKEDFGHGGAKFVTYLNVFNNVISDLNGTECVEIDRKQTSVNYGDVLFTISSETPEDVGLSSIWLGSEMNIYLNSFCFGYRPTAEFDLYYLGFMLRSKLIRKEIALLAQGVSRYNLSKKKVLDIEVPIPSIEEQIKLGKIFKNIENLIALHQRKLQKLQNIKKAYLNEMFI